MQIYTFNRKVDVVFFIFPYGTMLELYPVVAAILNFQLTYIKKKKKNNRPFVKGNPSSIQPSLVLWCRGTIIFKYFPLG